jgi:biotin carboxyl carrier protein
MESGTIHGETLAVPERVIVAPAPGTFRPLEPAEAAGAAVEGNVVADVVAEQVIGFVEGRGQSTPVRSPFGGRLMGLLAHAGERVREGQPVAWLRSAT